MPRVDAERGAHRAGRVRSRAAWAAAGLTAVVAVGAVALVGALRDGAAPGPSGLQAASPVPSAASPVPSAGSPSAGSPSAGSPGPSAGATARGSAPAVIGTLRAPTTRPTTPAPTTSRAAATARPAPAGPGKAGKATFYTLGGLPNCGYPDAKATGRYVALSPADLGASAACGTVLDVTGPEGTVRVTVADLCPECEPGHLDLAAPAFAVIADPVAGLVPVTYARVVDPPTAGPVRVRVKEGSSQYWFAVLPIDTGNPLSAVEARVGGTWQRLSRSGYGYWIAAKGTGPGPVPLRLTDDRGHTLTATIPVTPGATVSTGARLY